MSPPRYTLSITDIVIRGCERELPARLLESMRAHYFLPSTPQEWGLSVASMPGATEAEILKAARQIRQSHYRVASVNDLWTLNPETWSVPIAELAGLDYVSAVWDHNAHALIVSRREPTLERAEAIAALFGEPKPNPYYAERKRRHASR